MREFLRANGQTRDNFNFCEEGDDEDVDEEKPPFKDPKEVFSQAVAKEKMTWRQLKNRRVVWNGRSYPNPYFRRTENGWLGKSLTPFMLGTREKRKLSYTSSKSQSVNEIGLVLRDGGWEMSELEKCELERLRAMSNSSVYEAVIAGNSQKLDRQIRVFFAINCPLLFDKDHAIDNLETEATLKPLFIPRDYEDVTIHSCFFLRFPDYSPLSPLRELKTKNMFLELIKVKILRPQSYVSDGFVGC
jgi:hypothetical protein